MIVGCVPEWEGKILLCRRAIEPRLGYWTIPAGFMENNETVQQGAAREALEESLAAVEIGSPLAIVHVLHMQQVHFLFRGRMLSGHFGPSPESLEVGLYSAEDIPWQDLAFGSVRFALERYLQDRREGREILHFHSIP